MIPSHLYLAAFPTGSNYICNPPVTNTDIDMMFLVSSMEKTYDELIKLGWTYNSKDIYPPDVWASYRMGKDNAICTSEVKHFNAFLAATEEAKRLNLLDKKDRIELFDKYVGLGKKKYTYKQYVPLDMGDLIMPTPTPIVEDLGTEPVQARADREWNEVINRTLDRTMQEIRGTTTAN